MTMTTYQIIGLLETANPDIRVAKQVSFTVVENFSCHHPATMIIDSITPFLLQQRSVRIKTGYVIQTGNPPEPAYTVNRDPRLMGIHTTLVQQLQVLSVHFQNMSNILTGWQPLCRSNSTLLRPATEYPVARWALVDTTTARTYIIGTDSSPVELGSDSLILPPSTPPKQSNGAVLAITLAVTLGGSFLSLVMVFANPLLSLVPGLVALAGTIYGLIAGNTVTRIISLCLLLLVLMGLGLVVVAALSYAILAMACMVNERCMAF